MHDTPTSSASPTLGSERIHAHRITTLAALECQRRRNCLTLLLATGSQRQYDTSRANTRLILEYVLSRTCARSDATGDRDPTAHVPDPFSLATPRSITRLGRLGAGVRQWRHWSATWFACRMGHGARQHACRRPRHGRRRPHDGPVLGPTIPYCERMRYHLYETILLRRLCSILAFMCLSPIPTVLSMAFLIVSANAPNPLAITPGSSSGLSVCLCSYP